MHVSVLALRTHARLSVSIEDTCTSQC